MKPCGANNPYTRIRQQAAEIEKYRGHLLQYEHTYDASVRKARASARSANMDIDLLMAIIKEVRPWCYPGTLDNIVREHITTRGVSPATFGLVAMIEDTRQGYFIPIATPVPQITDKGPPTPVTEAKKKMAAFGVEEEEEEEEFHFGTE